MAVSVRRIDGAEASPTGLNFRRLSGVKAKIRRGYKVEFAPYPGTEGKWLIRLVRPNRGNPTDYKVDSYFEIVARNMDEAETFIKKDGLWDNALLERIAHRIGKRGEAQAFQRLGPGTRVVDASTGQTLHFDKVEQFQNNSGHGVDVLARLARNAEPDPPPNAGDFMAFEVKSTLGAADNPPGLRGDQRNAVEFVTTRLRRAFNEEGNYPELSDERSDLLFDARRTLTAGSPNNMHYRKIDVRMDHAGQMTSRAGRPAMELKSWP